MHVNDAKVPALKPDTGNYFGHAIHSAIERYSVLQMAVVYCSIDN